jgi:hypothetical protein
MARRFIKRTLETVLKKDDGSYCAEGLFMIAIQGLGQQTTIVFL